MERGRGGSKLRTADKYSPNQQPLLLLLLLATDNGAAISELPFSHQTTLLPSTAKEEKEIFFLNRRKSDRAAFEGSIFGMLIANPSAVTKKKKVFFLLLSS